MLKTLLLVAVLCCFLLALGTSHALEITPQSITTNLTTGQLYVFNVTFYNNATSPVNITINSVFTRLHYGASFENIGVSPTSFYLLPGQSKYVNFSLGTFPNFLSSGYIPIVFPYTNNGLNRSYTINVAVLPAPAANLISIFGISTPKSVYPYNIIKFNASIINGIGQTGVVVPFTYSMASGSTVLFNATESLTLNSLGLNLFSFSFPISPSTPPGTYNLTSALTYDGKTSEYSAQLEVLAYFSAPEKSSSQFNAFGGVASLTITNDGNTPINPDNYTLPISGFDSLFILSKSASSGSASFSGLGLVPSITRLQPGQSLTISYTVSYLPLYIIIILVVAAIVVFLYFNRKVVVSKEVVEHKASGGMIDVKLAIRVKSVARRPLRDLTILDVIPPNALKVSVMGPKEGHVSRTAHGLHITWKEAELNPGDEVLVMYEIKSKIGIVGGIDLGKAECAFYAGRNKHTKRSNSLLLNIK